MCSALCQEEVRLFGFFCTSIMSLMFNYNWLTYYKKSCEDIKRSSLKAPSRVIKPTPVLYSHNFQPALCCGQTNGQRLTKNARTDIESGRSNVFFFFFLSLSSDWVQAAAEANPGWLNCDIVIIAGWMLWAPESVLAQIIFGLWAFPLFLIYIHVYFLI